MSDAAPLPTDSQKKLKSFFDRIERLEAEKAAIAGDIKDIFAQAKSEGFDVKVMKKVLKDAKKSPAAVEEEQTMVEIYAHAYNSQIAR